jgi:putative transcriptional regulator
MIQAPYLVGQLLLAMPGIGDPRFEKAVIAMCNHDTDGAMGIGVGHLAGNITLHSLMKQLDIAIDAVADCPIHIGGPVEQQRGFVLHSLDWGGQGTVDVAGRWGLTSTLDVLRVIGTTRGPSKWLVALGYAGWGAGQLDGEMARHGWHATDGNGTILFDTQIENRWSAAFGTVGIDPRLLSSTSGHA